jgi:hypothetical protein
VEADCSRFLVAALHLDRLLVCNNIDDAYYYLERFPNRIRSLYDEAWERATGGTDLRVAQRAKDILMWVSITARPLSIDALEEALSASRRESNDVTVLTEGEIVAACAGLVRVELQELYDGSLPTITLSHLSVQEYLDENRQRYFPDADDAIVMACLFHSSMDDWCKAFPPPLGYTVYRRSHISKRDTFS